MSGWASVFSFSDGFKFKSSPHLVFLHHALYLVDHFAGVMRHSEVRHLAELVPADVDVVTQLLFQANPEHLGV